MFATSVGVRSVVLRCAHLARFVMQGPFYGERCVGSGAVLLSRTQWTKEVLWLT